VAGVDFQTLRSRVSIEQVLHLLDFVSTEVRGDQVRGGCPIHGSARSYSRSFSANFRKNTFRCFKCQRQGNQLDLWAAATGQSLYDAAIDLCAKLSLPVPRVER
jgi:DNA primase